jgi:hypothetical protein
VYCVLLMGGSEVYIGSTNARRAQEKFSEVAARYAEYMVKVYNSSAEQRVLKFSKLLRRLRYNFWYMPCNVFSNKNAAMPEACRLISSMSLSLNSHGVRSPIPERIQFSAKRKQKRPRHEDRAKDVLRRFYESKFLAWIDNQALLEKKRLKDKSTVEPIAKTQSDYYDNCENYENALISDYYGMGSPDHGYHVFRTAVRKP